MIPRKRTVVLTRRCTGRDRARSARRVDQETLGQLDYNFTLGDTFSYTHHMAKNLTNGVDLSALGEIIWVRLF